MPCWRGLIAKLKTFLSSEGHVLTQKCSSLRSIFSGWRVGVSWQKKSWQKKIKLTNSKLRVGYESPDYISDYVNWLAQLQSTHLWWLRTRHKATGNWENRVISLLHRHVISPLRRHVTCPLPTPTKQARFPTRLGDRISPSGLCSWPGRIRRGNWWIGCTRWTVPRRLTPRGGFCSLPPICLSLFLSCVWSALWGDGNERGWWSRREKRTSCWFRCCWCWFSDCQLVCIISDISMEATVDRSMLSVKLWLATTQNRRSGIGVRVRIWQFGGRSRTCVFCSARAIIRGTPSKIFRVWHLPVDTHYGRIHESWV